MSDFIVINNLSAKVPDESFNPIHAPMVLDVIKDLDSEMLGLMIDLAVDQAEFERVIDFLQRRRR